MTRGISWTLLGSWLSTVVQIGTTMVLARLLTPADFGIMAMALTLTVVVNQFRSLGLSQAVVQRIDLRWSHVNALFWINTAAGVVLAGLVALAGFPLAEFYREPALVPICLALGAGFAISGVAVQHGALLNRAMRFRTISLRNVAAGVLSSVAAVVAALLGMGIWALVVQNVSMLVFATLLNWWAVPWRPSRPSGLREALPLLGFGAHVSIANLFHTLSREGDNVIIGRALDAGALGLYTRAYSLLMLPLRQLKTPVQAVMVPTLAALQEEPARYRQAYRMAISGLGHLGMPVIVVLAVTAHELIAVALGDRWLAAAPIFQILAVASFVQLVSTTTGWIYTSTGRGAVYATWAVINGVVTVGGFVIGVRWGITGVAVSYAITQVLLILPGFALACRHTPVAVADPFQAMVRPALVSLLLLGAAVGVRSLVVPGVTELVALVVVAGCTAATWLLTMVVWRGARAELLALVAVVRKKKRPTS
ncbi:lipopolysaccharide biosynthesis protein [Georgenia sunbinii]|uniref:lipopolysaccharide biosynthesis protein n=1 Tax=Georgenia sunbinii TaxID=3117728 RepID=UPI002F268F6B